MVSTLLSTVYTVVVIAVAVVGVAGVMWMTRSRDDDDSGGRSRVSGTMITLAVAVFTLATAALLLA
jgi:MFS superfamily sulfate permease-like transporter